MDLGSLFLVVALAILVGIYVAQPFMKHSKAERLVPKASRAASSDHERSVLLAERDRILTALHELDFDHALGKIPEEDYPLQRVEMLKAGANILKQLDGIEPGQNSKELSAEDRVEAAVTARRADARRITNAGRGLDELDQAINGRRRQKQEKSAGFCPKCGSPVQKSDVHCSRCGATLK